jgi:hypothetical protein
MSVSHRSTNTAIEKSECSKIASVDTARAAVILRLIHRWDRGFTALCSKHGGWRECFYSTAELTPENLGILQLVGAPDSYFTLNTLGRPKRNTRSALYLNAVWVDLDPPKAMQQIDFWGITEKVKARQRETQFPEFSFLIDSGRGAWAIILLTAEGDATKPQLSTPEARRQQQEINKAMAAWLADLGADPAVHDAARVVRLPSSVNSRTGLPVIYYPQQDASGRLYTSTLAKLSAFFHLEKTITPTIAQHGSTAVAAAWVGGPFPRRSNADPQRSEWGKWGQRARFEKELAGLRSLERLRGGFGKYQRSNAVFIQSLLLRFLRHDQAEVETQALMLGSRCCPPLPCEKCLAMAADPHTAKYSRFPWTRRKILRKLGVTLGELYQIPQWKPKQKRCPANSEKGTGDRRELVLRAIQEHGPMSLSEMQAHLSAQRHFVSRETVSRDYAALGIVWKAKPGRRTAKNGENSPHIPFSPTLGFRVDNSFSRGRKSSLLSRGSSPKGLGSLRPPHEIRKCPCGNNAADSISSAMRRTARA